MSRTGGGDNEAGSKKDEGIERETRSVAKHGKSPRGRRSGPSYNERSTPRRPGERKKERSRSWFVAESSSDGSFGLAGGPLMAQGAASPMRLARASFGSVGLSTLDSQRSTVDGRLLRLACCRLSSSAHRQYAPATPHLVPVPVPRLRRRALVPVLADLRRFSAPDDSQTRGAFADHSRSDCGYLGLSAACRAQEEGFPHEETP